MKPNVLRVYHWKGGLNQEIDEVSKEAVKDFEERKGILRKLAKNNNACNFY